MIRILVVSDNPSDFDELQKYLLENKGVHVETADSFEKAMTVIDSALPSLVIVDEHVEGAEGKKVIEDMIRKNPMINTALVSSLSHDDFHEYTEGLGVLMAVNKEGGKDHAAEVVDRIEKILSLYR